MTEVVGAGERAMTDELVELDGCIRDHDRYLLKKIAAAVVEDRSGPAGRCRRILRVLGRARECGGPRRRRTEAGAERTHGGGPHGRIESEKQERKGQVSQALQFGDGPAEGRQTARLYSVVRQIDRFVRGVVRQ